MNGQFLKDKIDDIRIRLNHGLITYDEAKNEAKPYIKEMNEKAAEICQKYGKKFRPFSFAALMR